MYIVDDDNMSYINRALKYKTEKGRINNYEVEAKYETTLDGDGNIVGEIKNIINIQGSKVLSTVL